LIALTCSSDLRRRALVVAFAMLAVAMLAGYVRPSVAAAVESGSLSQLPSPLNCISEQGFEEELIEEGHEAGLIGCGVLLPKGTLENSYQAQVSPDGRNVYSVAVSGDLIEYSRDQANGTLTEIGCVTSGASACAPASSTTNAIAMSSPAAMAISPEGTDVYVVTQGTNSLVEFSREPATGLLTEIGCLSQADLECASHEADGLELPYGIAISPGGASVYVASHDSDAIAEFSRDASTGELAQLARQNNCITSGSGNGCGTEGGVGLESAIGVAVSPDGRSVYVAAGGTERSGAIASFERNTSTGALTQLPGKEGCISTANVSCTHGVGIDGPEDLVISPDGRDVYTNSSEDNAVLELRREPSGALAQLAPPNACLMKAPVEAGCSEAKGLEKALGVAISPGGEDVYASSAREDDEAEFARNAETGVLAALPAPNECAGKSETEGEVDNECGTQRIHGIAGARRVTVSPDGMNLYVAGQNDRSVVELARAVTPAVSGVSPATGPYTGGTTVTIAGSGFVEGAAVEFGATSATSVTVNSASSMTAVSPAGSGTVNVTVSTYAGTSAANAGDGFTYSAPPNTGPLISLPGPLVVTVPPPVLARTGNVAPISGKVLVRVPGSSKFVPLSSLQQIPFGTVIEATHGHVSVTTAQPNGTTQTGEFFEGEFILEQGRNGLVIAELTGGNFSVCPTARERAHKASVLSAHAATSGKHVVRKLWANAHGSFETKGNYAAGAVQGTEWLTEDLCEGTLIRVTRDKVRVTNLVTHHHVEVKVGHKYLAKAP
jgi:DNA-binding beta-propeller fold protein YncE